MATGPPAVGGAGGGMPTALGPGQGQKGVAGGALSGGGGLPAAGGGGGVAPGSAGSGGSGGILGGRRHALAARKSPWMALDFDVAGDMLNQIEAAMGEIPGWRASDGLWLDGPEEGTCIRPTELLAVLTRA